MPRQYSMAPQFGGSAQVEPVGEASGEPQKQVGLIVVAAGASSRMAGVDKIFTPVLGVPLIVHTVEAFESQPIVGDMVLVLSPDKVGLGRELARERRWAKVTPERVCQGGQRRQDSVRLGLEHLAPSYWVAVHDGARPCIGPDLLAQGIEAARETGAAVAAVPAKDTIKVVSPANNLVEATPSRDTLWMVQTPQVFRYDLLMQAHRLGEMWETATDDAAMVERLGHKVKVFMGSHSNLKVTTPEDLAMAEILLRTMKTRESN